MKLCFSAFSAVKNEILFIDGSAIRTDTFVLQLLMAASTEVKSPCVLEIAIEGEEDVGDAEGGGKENGEQGNHQIQDHANTQEGEKIEERLDRRQQLQHIVNHREHQQEQRPHGAKEQAQQHGLREGIQRGVVVELNPHLRVVVLDEGIEQG